MADHPEPIGTRVEITSDKPGAWDATIKVGGHQIAPTRVVLDLDAKSLPVFTITLPVIHGLDIDVDHVYVALDAETSGALVALGWTPPGEAVRHVTVNNRAGPVRNDREIYDAVQRQTLIR